MIQQLKLLFIVLLGFHSAIGQTSFYNIYGGNQHDHITSVLFADSSGYFFAGHTNSYGAGGTDAFLVKLNTNGDTVWTNILGLAGDEIVVSAVNSNDGGFVVLGVTFSFSLPFVFLLKINNTGVVVWCHYYNYSDLDEPIDLIASPNGGYLITGNALDGFTSDKNISLLKTDSMGLTEWIKSCCSSENDLSGSISISGDGGYIVTGVTGGFGAIDKERLLVKYDSLGNLTWTKMYNNSSFNYPPIVYISNDGGYLLTGSFYNSFTGTVDAYLMKTNPVGDTMWTKSYDTPDHEMIYDIQQTGDNGFVLVGSITSNGNDDIFVLRTDSIGNVVWTKTYGGPYMDVAKSIKITPDQGLLIGGSTKISSSVFWDAFVIKTDSMGISNCNYQDIFRAAGYSSLLVTNPISLNSTENSWTIDTVFNSVSNSQVNNFCTIIGLTDPIFSQSIQVIPNPANDIFRVELNSTIPGTLEICNVHGQTIYSHKIAEFPIEINSSDFPTGMYYILTKNKDYVSYSKLIIVR